MTAPLLDAAARAAALQALPSWGGTTDRISRTVPGSCLPEVARLADEADHHPVVEPAGDDARLVLWTHSAGGVTAQDTALAARIDALLTG